MLLRIGAVVASLAVSTLAHAQEWPSFRGPGGTGVADGASPPLTWDLEKGVNVRWKTAVPGFAHSSPVVWGNRVFLTTAIPSDESKVTFRRGEAVEGPGASAYSKDDFPHAWRVYALDKDSGKILWERTAHEGVPKTARHVMASQANSTPVTDGTHVVAFFGSEGLYCYDFDGKLVWKQDLGTLSSGRYLDPSYEWNTASSPILHKNLVIVQVDIVESSFIAAFDIKTGKQVWRTERDEQPSWPTPLLYRGPPRTELITAAPSFTRAYDPDTGKELWRLGRHSALSTPTPVAGRGLVYVTSGGGTTVQPIYAIRPGGSGDITLKDGEQVNGHVAWSKHRGGAYIPTPLYYGDLLYVLSNNGILAVYNGETGERVYQERLGPTGGFSASPVAADGNIFFSGEDGEVVVVKAGPKFERLAINSLHDVNMTTPAIANRMLIFRTQHHVIAVGEPAAKATAKR